ncbi:T9SS type A sorting domain-containing protein [Pseudochryseolinea flava]|uniref:Secretion system C-terminal sorting domain-containing protein n=1 Tax=Pseudochryseolinea flava TaxID=2059302 RepID=A0A364XZG0_9BACT|nr:hypothetical protein [Pseudochryseolinea flava]RAV99774.1 hypothetical protein DQQ10_17160 [Pseudochryseolinea flava]
MSNKIFAITIVITLLALPKLTAQTATMNNSGDWGTDGNWSGNNIGNTVAETITISNNVSPTVANGNSFTVGSITLANNNTLTVNGTLNIGDASNSRSLTTNNNANVNVAGTLIIWGNVTVNNNINWSISGTVIIKGNLVMVNNANVAVSGNLRVDGNLTGGNNTNVAVSGLVSVGGSTNVGNGSNLNGCAGCYQSGGSCTGPASFCGSGALPVTLVSFKAKPAGDVVTLNWVTATEENAEKFVIERSADGISFETISEVAAAGNSTSRIEYNATDNLPLLGRNYYRLRIVDLDGYTEYSNVITLTHEGKKTVLIYPNPLRGSSFNLVKNFQFESDATLEIIDNLGVKIRSMKITDLEQEIQFGEPLNGGAYLLKVFAGDFSTTIRFSVSQ